MASKEPKFPFMKLPIELRWIILEHALSHNHEVIDRCYPCEETHTIAGFECPVCYVTHCEDGNPEAKSNIPEGFDKECDGDCSALKAIHIEDATGPPEPEFLKFASEVNRALYIEALPFYYQHNTFNFEIHDDFDGRVTQYLQQLHDDFQRSKLLRHVSILISSWVRWEYVYKWLRARERYLDPKVQDNDIWVFPRS